MLIGISYRRGRNEMERSGMNGERDALMERSETQSFDYRGLPYNIIIIIIITYNIYTIAFAVIF